MISPGFLAQVPEAEKKITVSKHNPLKK